MKKLFVGIAPLCLFCAGLSAQPAAPLMLREHWAIQSSALDEDSGEAISKPGYKTTGWYPATMPSTVVAALVANKVYPDPGFGMNLRGYAGESYPIGMNFSNVHMPPDSPYRVPWWFRTEFTAPAEHKGKTLWLRFDGINYRANVWLNGKRIADANTMAGAWRLFEYNVTEAIRPGAANALAVEVFGAAARRSGDHVRGLESGDAGQGHGPVARCASGCDGAGSDPVSAGDYAFEFAGQR